LCAQAGVERFCTSVRPDRCAPDSLEVRFADGGNVAFDPSSPVDVAIVLDTTSGSVQGWSYGVSHDADVLRLVEDRLTIDGTDAAAAMADRPSFVRLIAVPAADGAPPGFVSTVVLSLATPARLAADRENTLAFATYHIAGDIPPEGTQIRFVDGVLRDGDAEPAAIALSIDDRSLPPSALVHGVLTDGVERPELCDDGIDNDFDGQVDAADRDCWVEGTCPEPPVETFCFGERDCIPDTLEIRFGSKNGPDAHRVLEEGDEVRAVVVFDLASEGISGWAYGVSHDPDVLTIIPDSVTTRGTDADWILRGAFNVTTAVDSVDGGPPGFISAVVMTDWVVRPLDRYSVAAATYRVTGAVPADGTLLRFEDGVLANAPSPPIALNVTVNGVAKRPTTLQGGLVCRGVRSMASFRRGDADGSTRHDVADAVRIVRFVAGRLAGGDPTVACHDAFDVDDDGRLGFADAVALLGYLFGRGTPPVSPFPDCGFDDTADELDCPAAGQPSC